MFELEEIIHQLAQKDEVVIRGERFRLMNVVTASENNMKNIKEESIIMKCCICHKEIPEGSFGNNPEGAVWKTRDGKIEMPEFKEDDRCCDECNGAFVIPGRMYRMAKAKANE